MKVRELIAYLQQVSGDALILVSSDAEGNSFHALHEATVEPMKQEDNRLRYAAGYAFDERPDAARNSIVLWPS